MSDEAEVEIARLAAPAEAFAGRLVGLLNDAARSSGHGFEETPLVLEARAGGAFAGGLMGHLENGVFYVRRLAVSPEARTGGIGRALMATAEDWARERGARAVFLDTFGFQAPDFYPRLGYVEAFRLPGRTGSEARFYYVKRLDEAS
ncbi:MAG: GNAT family N-acetyltransferase [Paracoccaceae bacterium]